MMLKKIKSICIVGNAHTIVGRKLGKKIDNFPWVVRFSTGMPHLNREFMNDIGTRTDIYAHRGKLYPEVIGGCLRRVNVFFTDVNDGVRAMCSEFGVEVYQLDSDADGYADVLDIPSFFSGRKLTTGLSFIGKCLQAGIRDINICGFTTEENYDPKAVSEFCWKAKGKEETNEEYELARRNSHDFKAERSILSKLIRQKRIKFL